MGRYGLATYGVDLYGSTAPGGFDASPVRARFFPISYTNADDLNFQPWYPSQYSPAASDPDISDYPDLTWNNANLSQTLVDFYADSYRELFSADVGEDFFYLLLTWSRPEGQWTDLRVVKKRYGPSETVDDGLTVLELPYSTNRTEYTEVMSQGEIANYSIWVRSTIGVWHGAGSVDVVNNLNHDGLEEFFKAIPRIYTSSTGGMLDVVDREGQLSRFLQGLAFEMDLWKTQADRLSADPGLLYPEAVALWAKQLGMTDLDIVTIGDRNLRRWLTSASSFSETKGTINGIESLASAITGWPITAEVSPNLMLDTDDSSGENSVGRWVATSGTLSRAQITGGVDSPVDGGVITNSSATAPHLQGYVLTFAPSAATSSLELGTDDPISHGIPVTAGTTYKCNICWKCTVTTTGSIDIDLEWFDINGTSISTTSGSTQSASASWQQATTVSGAAPAGAAYAGIILNFTGVTGSPVYHLDMGQFVENATDISGKFYDARAITLQVSPVRVNYCTNPTFEVNTTGWSVGTQGAANSGYVGSTSNGKSLVLDDTEITSGVYYSQTGVGTFAEDDPVYVSLYVKAAPNNGDPTCDLPLEIEAIDAGLSFIDNETTVVTDIPTGSYQRISLLMPSCPASTSAIQVKVAGTGTSANMTAAGSTLDIDGMLIEKTDRLLSYFDAAMLADTGQAAWAGTAHNSASYLYPHRLARQSILSRVMADAVPEPVYLKVELTD